MARMTVVWLWRATTLAPGAKLGFFQCVQTLADSLVAAGVAQWTRIGAFRFKHRNYSILPGAPVTLDAPISVSDTDTDEDPDA